LYTFTYREHSIRVVYKLVSVIQSQGCKRDFRVQDQDETFGFQRRWDRDLSTISRDRDVKFFVRRPC